ncbi:hypothetical protein MI170_07125 [Mycolicibacterium goodii]|uniref:hypothetical protein n=1 Tax=Mycolicibacterium goodii TaxID=134601 RepID=UPI001F049D06|nr:hypothetical protein [Mycolicibacterium goodii]ULN49131.1 hypothetical protein MI170_07125 [Mycolicibacterium goodii]
MSNPDRETGRVELRVTDLPGTQQEKAEIHVNSDDDELAEFARNYCAGPKTSNKKPPGVEQFHARRQKATDQRLLY